MTNKSVLAMISLSIFSSYGALITPADKNINTKANANQHAEKSAPKLKHINDGAKELAHILNHFAVYVSLKQIELHTIESKEILKTSTKSNQWYLKISTRSDKHNKVFYVKLDPTKGNITPHAEILKTKIHQSEVVEKFTADSETEKKLHLLLFIEKATLHSIEYNKKAQQAQHAALMAKIHIDNALKAANKMGLFIHHKAD